MLDDLAPVGLADAARRLGTEPFEVVRLLVAAAAVPEGPLMIDATLIERLREIGGIEPTWWHDQALPKDKSPARARVRAALEMLISRGRVGDQQTRMDNVWRGLDPADQEALQLGLGALAEDGVLRITATPVGLKISVEAGQKERAEKIASGKEESAPLSAALAGRG